ncbi:hypothetical protein K491DRAFT_25074 [Lophiostoma macrostomum CBS 122681]|uniref:BTB domain-containing protein n=1 Tax=Lophiostoma macrostomum CBS 122681 TaxID=1314788 RepID=A0A6A6T1B0_9PLEO|nr:hypothetical protein K491DRAFT_25074 [Lophiostoma macrostomum CBS 122681]
MYFDTLPRANRASLLEGPTVFLILNYSGTNQDRAHQVDIAQGIATSERCKQLSDHHLHSPHNRYKIEIPQAALVAASSVFRTFIQSKSASTSIELDFGGILPGYALEVVDWYVRSLRTERWQPFPVSLDVAGLDYGDADRRDWWYYYYVYVAMRNLHLDTAITAPLQDFLCDKTERCGLCDGFEGLVQVLKHLREDDPVVDFACRRHAGFLSRGSWLMYEAAYVKTVELFPWFQGKIEGMIAELSGDGKSEGEWDDEPEEDLEDEQLGMIIDGLGEVADTQDAVHVDKDDGLIEGARPVIAEGQSFYGMTMGIEEMHFGD